MYIKFKCTTFKTHYVIGKDIFAQTDAWQKDATQTDAGQTVVGQMDAWQKNIFDL